MSQQTTLADEYTDGVYYDRDAGDFCEIVETDETIGLRVPHTDNDPYFTFDEIGFTKSEAIDEIEQMFTEVSNEAVENPTETVEQALRMMSRNDPNESMSYPEQEAIDLMYARGQVKITEA